MALPIELAILYNNQKFHVADLSDGGERDEYLGGEPPAIVYMIRQALAKVKEAEQRMFAAAMRQAEKRAKKRGAK